MKMVEYKFKNGIVRFHGNPPPKEVLEKLCVEFAKGVMNDGYKIVSASDRCAETNKRV